MGADRPDPLDADEESLRKAFVKKDGDLGDVETSGSWFFSSSWSLGEYAAPKGLCVSSLVRGALAFGVVGAFMLDADGGVEPEENLELRLEIHEFLRPICRGELFWGASVDADSLASSAPSSLFPPFPPRAPVVEYIGFGSVTRAGDSAAGGGEFSVTGTVRSARGCEVGGASASFEDLSLTVDDADLQRDKSAIIVQSH